MKTLWLLCAATGFLFACGNNDVGNRTYDLNTPTDSANMPIYGTTGDTTPTSNNNIYNPDSIAGQSPRDTSAVRKYGQPGQSTGQPNVLNQSGQAGQY